MEISDLVSARKFREFSTKQKEELYETLLQLIVAIEEIPKKSLRRTLDVTLAVLQYKGEQVADLQSRLEDKESSEEDDSRADRLLDENEKLKVMLERLEDEKLELKNKVKELTEDIFQLQKRMQEAAQTAAAEGSDKDSSDPLSELDKQEDLLRNINSKNKHIKRLLREIEALQTQNIAQSKTIIECETELQQSKTRLLQLSADITLVDSERKALKETVNELNIEITRLEGNITYLEEEREKSERDLKSFIEKLEIKAQSWKNMLDARDKEVKKLRARLEKIGEPTSFTDSLAQADKDSPDKNATASDDEEETTKLLHALESRDKHIESLEFKIKCLAEEMMSSTRLMNQLSAEKEEARNPNKTRACCKTIEESLQAANERCRELSEMLERSEEDNTLKSKQAMQAIASLEAYQRGEDGLVKALRKCTALEQKVISRDKQIRALIMELNSMHEIAHENGILRKRLNIPDDMVISAKNLVAKERNKDKMIERLTLKLRASEEMRLQLKLEKNDLRKELLELQKQLQKPAAAPIVEEERATIDSLRIPSEVGEVTESGNASNVEYNTALNFCVNCKLSLELPDEATQVAAVNQLKYQDVVDENDTLRAGMLEILEKLREYDASSDHITIDTEMLYRLLEALRTSSVPNTPKRLQSELQALKACEEALRALIKQQPSPAQDQDYGHETDELSSVESMREGTEQRNCYDEELSLHLPNLMDSSTRPTTPNKNIKQQELPVIQNDVQSEFGDEARKLQLQVAELKIYRQRFEDLQQQLKSSDAELTQSNADLSAQLANAQLELTREKCSYSFMREEFDNTLNEVKQNELRHIEQMTSLRKELATLKDKLLCVEKDYNQLRDCDSYSKEEFLQLQATNCDLRTRLAAIIEQLFAGKLDTELKIPDICADYGIINENLQLDYLTAEEYRNLHTSLKEAQQQCDESLRKSAQLESLLEIAQSQIQSQQKLLNEITDNHVNLRHLVADLQSNTEEKLLLAKMQRELDSANIESSNLRFELDQLKQKCAILERDVDAKDQKLNQLTKGFQMERSTKDIKIKFLQKSMYVLREKYAKFTPLIFLTNFVFAYTKFVKKSLRSTDNGVDINKLTETIKEAIILSLRNESVAVDESQNLIKLIKSETQCKLLERSLQELQSKYDILQEELLEQRILSAKETEHWQTIEALFGSGIKDDSPPNIASENQLNDTDTNVEEQYRSMRQKDVTTNTEAPVPAERKLPATPTLKRKSTVEMLDKNLSPIGSPTRRLQKADATTQTSDELNADISDEASDRVAKTLDQPESTQNVALLLTAEEEPKKATQLVGQLLSKETNDAIVQTVEESTACQSVQTETLTAGGELQLRDEMMSKELDARINEMKQKLSERDIRLEECKTELLTATKLIEELQGELDHVKSSSETKMTAQVDTSPKSDIIEKTILSFHTLLSEKDKSISKYQDLLQTEREQIQSTNTKLNNEIDDLKSTITNLNFNIKTKDMEILELKTQLEVASVRRHSAEKLELATGAVGGGGDESVDNSLNELTDEKIEEMFQQDPSTGTTGALNEREVPDAAGGGEQLEKQDNETMKEIPTLLKQVKELKEKASYWEKTLAVRQEELSLLQDKVNLYEERDKSMENAVNPEMEQLRQLLEEKDKHINELTETLNNFHDDQQRYFKDSSSYSADQISKLHADLTRTEATNKIYHTQVDALRRQIASLTQREKQARELNQSLRNQLIKRPVVSIKTELNARVKTENLQKRIHSLELELEEARAQIQRQQIVLDAKRAKSASEVGLWEKQKRWQQNAEKFKAKFEEADAALEKTRTLLQSARTMIARLEKEKQTLEIKLSRAGPCGAMQVAMKCCRTPSCPNLQHSGGGGKYTPSESPETYTGASSECSSPAHSANERHKHMQTHFCVASRGNGDVCSAADKHQPHAELIEALKARIELQQRKILAMELEGKGSNALTTEMEKLQEKLSEIEAQNIRLEAKNLQLQLDNDLQRQGNATERLQKRIKYLEDYIIALKEEIAQVEARRELCKCSGIKLNTHLGQSAEQTILSLRGIVEKLRAENKFLKDGRRACEARNLNETNNADVSRLQKLYAESIDKIAALQVELNVKAKCRACGKADTHVNDELAFIKEQLSKKTQLLQKAKVLLTRAAAKEKVLKEQLLLWKRKCSELQNVPVIDEISE